jgi:hypothetical protein
MRVLKGRWAAIPLLLIALAAILRTDLVLDMGWFIRCWALLALPAFAILLFPVFYSQGTLSFYLGMLTHTLVYLVCLIGSWVAGATNASEIAGIFPYSDAGGYFQDAILLAAGKDFSPFSAKRPLFSGLLAAGLGWTDLNLKLVLIFFAVTASVAAFLFSKQVAKLFGPPVGFIALFLSFLFYRRFLGSLLTENLGLSLGLLGAALLLQSLRMEKYRVILPTYGLFVLTMALLARAGAFLILPAILFYFWQNDRKNTQPVFMQNWWSVVAGATAICVAFACNFLVRQSTGSINIPLGNAVYSFYGMAAGYKGWTQFSIDHPELKGVQEPPLIHQALNATLALIEHQPLQLVKAVLFSFGDFFMRTFGFAKVNFLFQDFREHLVLNLIVVGLLNVSLFCGLFRLWKRRSESREASFLLFAFTGILLSAPFAPPIDADSMRAYAATFPFLILITAFGMAGLFGLKPQGEKMPERTVLPMLISLSAGLILIAVLGPWFVRGRVRHAFSQVQKVCPAGEKDYIFQTRPVLAVDLVEQSGQTFKDSYPSTKVNLESFKKNLPFNEYLSNPNREQLNHVSSGSTIFMGREIADDRVRFFLAATPEVENKKGILSACSDSLDGDQSNQGWFTLVKIHSLEELSVP